MRTRDLAGVEALVVPVAPVATPSLHTALYTTRRGDTLVSIADRFGVSLDQLRRWNKIPSGIKVEPGRRLHVAEPATVQRSTTRHRGANSKLLRRRRMRPVRCQERCFKSSSKQRKHSAARRNAAAQDGQNKVEPYCILVFSCALPQAIATMASACGVE